MKVVKRRHKDRHLHSERPASLTQNLLHMYLALQVCALACHERIAVRMMKRRLCTCTQHSINYLWFVPLTQNKRLNILFLLPESKISRTSIFRIPLFPHAHKKRTSIAQSRSSFAHKNKITNRGPFTLQMHTATASCKHSNSD